MWYQGRIVAFFLVVMAFGSATMAQIPSGLSLPKSPPAASRPASTGADLAFTLKGRAPVPPAPTALGEFSISFDNRLLMDTPPLAADRAPDDPTPATAAGNGATADGDVVFSYSDDDVLTPVFPRDRLDFRAGTRFEPPPLDRPWREIRSVSPQPASNLTLLSGERLEMGSRRPLVAAAPTWAADGRVGRFQLHGEVAVERVETPIVRIPPRTTSMTNGSARGSLLVDRSIPLAAADAGGRLDLPENRSMTIDRYTLEASYHFSPRIEGRLTYRRSLADVRVNREGVDVEGAVKAGSDLTIKAGYGNQTTPEPVEGQPVNDTKVWTEFLLKF